MEEVATQGRTILFVSHNMGSVGRLCRTGMLLDQGRMVFSGDMSETIARYTEGSTASAAEVTFPTNMAKNLQMSAARLLDESGIPSTELDRTRAFTVSVDYVVRLRIEGAHLGIMLDRIDGTPVCHTTDVDAAPEGVIDRKPGSYRATVTFPGGILNAGVYQIRLGLARYGGDVYDYCEPFVFHLEDRGTFATMGAQGQQRQGILALPLNWQTSAIE
jgi:lipopolysaccharide transport system ATP-binding protein